MKFDRILNEVYALKTLFDENVNDGFGASILTNEIEDMIVAGMRLHETEVDINTELIKVDMELENIRNIVPTC